MSAKCQIHCPGDFIYSELGDRVNVPCTSSEILVEPKLFFDNIVYNPKAHAIEPNEVFRSTHFFQTNESTLLTSFDETKPLHYVSYTIEAICKGSGEKINQTFTMIEKANRQAEFTEVDYVIFAAFLVISMSIGIGSAAWAFIKQRRSHTGPTTDDFLLASRQMGMIPLSLSLLSSFMSAITLIGTPSEIYVYGTQYLISCISAIVFMPVAAHVLMPFFYDLGITSVYEFLEIRFSKSVRRLSAFVYIIHMTLYTAMVIYTPSLALEAVTGLNMWISASASSIICIIYTTLGGLRSAIWTDVFQVTLMIVGLIIILIQGSYREAGLFERAWTAMERSGRLEFWNFDPNPLLRHTFWTVLIGGILNDCYTYGINQAQIQRAISAKTLRQAQIAYWLNAPGLIILIALPGLVGFIVYARYQYCDPLTIGLVDKRDQIVPLYVMEVLAEDLPGFPGIFCAMLFSGALSSISSVLNGLGAVVTSDFAKDLWYDRFNVSEKARARFTRLITLIFGIITLLVILIIQSLPGILDAAIALTSAFGGPIFGLFIVGIYFPFIRWPSAFAGVVLSLGLTIWLVLGNMITAPKNFTIMERSTEACLNISATERVFIPEDPVDLSLLSDWEKFYSVSYMYYSAIGFLGTIVISLASSLVFGLDDPTQHDGIVNSTCLKWSVSFVNKFRKADNKIKHKTDSIETSPNEEITTF